MQLTELRLLYRHAHDGRGGTRLLVIDADLVDAELEPGVIDNVRTAVLARGVPVGPSVPWYYGDPSRLPDRDLAWQWGQFVSESITRAVGCKRLDELLEASDVGENAIGAILESGSWPGRLVRLLFRAVDPAAARIPFETLIWPRGDRGNHIVGSRGRALSIVREVDSLSALRSAAIRSRCPGTHRVLILTPSGMARLLTDERQGCRNGLARVDMFEPPDVRSDAAHLRALIESRVPDLIVVNGHGRMQRGLQVDLEGAREWLGGSQILGGLDRLDVPVILAMCGSAAASAGETSVALEVARAGLPLVVGFQGEESLEPDVRQLTDRLLEHLKTAVSGEANDGSQVSLIAWELAVLAARADLGGVPAVTPAVYIHPSLSIGRESPPPVPSASRAVTSTAWYVPGQVLCFAHRHRLLRIPLPVDVGTRLTVRLTENASHDVVATGRATPSINATDLADVSKAWRLPARTGVHVTVAADADARAWAARAAELSAVVRALEQLLGEPSPPLVRQLLDSAVAASWGAHDSAPRVVTDTGRCARQFDAWPAVWVRTPRRRLEAFPGFPKSPHIPFRELHLDDELLESAFTRRGWSGLCNLIVQQRDSLDADSLPEEMKRQLRVFWIVGPGLALAVPSDSAEPSHGPTLGCVIPPAADCPDVLA